MKIVGRVFGFYGMRADVRTLGAAGVDGREPHVHGGRNPSGGRRAGARDQSHEAQLPGQRHRRRHFGAVGGWYESVQV